METATVFAAVAADNARALASRAYVFARDPQALTTAYLLVPACAVGLAFLITFLVRTLYQLVCSGGSKRGALEGRLVLVTGGSSGIGRAVACNYAARGAHVVIMARTKAKLADAVEEILAARASKEQSVAYLACDVTDKRAVDEAVEEMVALHGVPDHVVTSHGAAYPGYFFDQEVEVFERTMRLNYMGNVHVLKSVAPLMAQRGSGRIVIVASAAAVVSFIGYASYSPTKFALRGLADALRSELGAFGVRVSIAYPPDTDTAGFKREKEMAPPETAACFPADPFSSEAVAGAMVDSVLLGDYHVQSPDPLQNLLVSSMSGVTPRAYMVAETLLAPLLVLVEQLFWPWFDHQARNYAASERAPAWTAVENEEEEEDDDDHKED